VYREITDHTVHQDDWRDILGISTFQDVAAMETGDQGDLSYLQGGPRLPWLDDHYLDQGSAGPSGTYGPDVARTVFGQPRQGDYSLSGAEQQTSLKSPPDLNPYPISPFQAFYRSRSIIPDITIEDVTSWSVLCPIISTYVDRLHPLFPAVHRPTFTDRFMRRADRTDGDFRSVVLALGTFDHSFPSL